jgi:C-terminal processing protease CtpA/Prc
MHVNSQPCREYIQHKNNMKGNALICPEAMFEDLRELYQNILKTHPNPFIYCSKNELDSAYTVAQNAVLTPKSVLDFSLILAGFIKNIRDSHTYFNPRDILVLSGNKSRAIPFYLTKIDSRFYMSQAYNNCIPVGAEILEVGTMTIDSLFNLSMRFSPKEAYTESAREEITTKMMGLVFNVQNNSSEHEVRFKYVNRLGDTLLTKVGRIRSKKLFKNENWYPSKELEYEFFNDIAYLRVYSFESKNEKKFKKTIDRFFSIVATRNIDSVIIDVRENRGGFILLLEHLLSYINVNEQTYDLNYSYKRSDLDRFESLSRLKKIDFIKKAKRVYPRGMISKEYDFYLSPKGTVKTILYQKKLANSSNYIFRGNCSLYINGLSMSASVLLASWFKENNRGEIIGTPCFGSLNATHGNPATIFLRNSGLPISISTLKLTPNNLMKSKWGDFHIDKKITLSLKDLELGVDPFTLDSIKD